MVVAAGILIVASLAVLVMTTFLFVPYVKDAYLRKTIYLGLSFVLGLSVASLILTILSVALAI